MKKLNSDLLESKVQGSTDEIWGGYWIKHPTIKDYYFYAHVGDGAGWDHVSISMFIKKGKYYQKPVKRCPTWDEMCFIKKTFWNENETVVQYHPAASDYVNVHNYVLHLWKPQDEKLPVPLPVMV